jgi:hypothetical protein
MNWEQEVKNAARKYTQKQLGADINMPDHCEYHAEYDFKGGANWAKEQLEKENTRLREALKLIKLTSKGMPFLIASKALKPKEENE